MLAHFNYLICHWYLMLGMSWISTFYTVLRLNIYLLKEWRLLDTIFIIYAIKKYINQNLSLDEVIYLHTKKINFPCVFWSWRATICFAKILQTWLASDKKKIPIKTENICSFFSAYSIWRYDLILNIVLI